MINILKAFIPFYPEFSVQICRDVDFMRNMSIYDLVSENADKIGDDRNDLIIVISFNHNQLIFIHRLNEKIFHHENSLHHENILYHENRFYILSEYNCQCHLHVDCRVE